MYTAQPLPGIARLRNDICKAYMTITRPDQLVKLGNKTERRNLQDKQVQGGLIVRLSTLVQRLSHHMLWRCNALRST